MFVCLPMRFSASVVCAWATAHPHKGAEARKATHVCDARGPLRECACIGIALFTCPFVIFHSLGNSMLSTCTRTALALGAMRWDVSFFLYFSLNRRRGVKGGTSKKKNGIVVMPMNEASPFWSPFW